MEEWKDIKGYEGYYQVSNFGRVKSLERYAIGVKYGKPFKYKKNTKMLKQQNNGRGYLKVWLYNGSLRNHLSIHRLVAEAFVPNPENKRCVNHLDGNKSNNCTENLEWNTHSENSIHSFKIGLQDNKGINHPGSKLNEHQVISIMKMIKTGVSQDKIAEIFNISQSSVSSIKLKKTWTHLNE